MIAVAPRFIDTLGTAPRFLAGVLRDGQLRQAPGGPMVIDYPVRNGSARLNLTLALDCVAARQQLLDRPFLLEISE